MILRHLLFWAASPHNSLFFTRTWFPSLFPQIPAVLNPHSNRKFFVGMFGRAWRPRGSPKKEPEVLFIGRPCCVHIYIFILNNTYYIWYVSLYVLSPTAFCSFTDVSSISFFSKLCFLFFSLSIRFLNLDFTKLQCFSRFGERCIGQMISRALVLMEFCSQKFYIILFF